MDIYHSESLQEPKLKLKFDTFLALINLTNLPTTLQMEDSTDSNDNNGYSSDFGSDFSDIESCSDTERDNSYTSDGDSDGEYEYP